MDEFAKLVREQGEPQQRSAVASTEAEKYRGRLPNSLIRFWLEHGRGCYGNGKDWICDPALFVPVVEAVFKDDPEFDPIDLVVIKRTAFADLTMWSRSLAGPVTVNFNTGEVSAFGLESWIDAKTGKRQPEDFIAGALFNRAKFVEAWVTEEDEDMLPLAIKRCGLLNADEVYGFFPALQMGGTNSVEKSKRVKIVEHLLLLSDITHFDLIRTEYSGPSDPGGYRRSIVRRIGSK